MTLASQSISAAWSTCIRAKFNGSPTGAALQFAWQFGNNVADFDSGYLHDHSAAGFRDAFYWMNTAAGYFAAQISPSTGVWNVITCTFDGSNIRCYLNKNSAVTTGVTGSQGTSTYTLGLFNNNAGALSQGIDGDLSNFAKWNVCLSDGDAASLGDGYHPSHVRPQNLTHAPDIWGDVSPEPDKVSGQSWTISGTLAKAPHPSVIMPSRRLIGFAGTSPPPPPPPTANSNLLLMGVGD